MRLKETGYAQLTHLIPFQRQLWTTFAMKLVWTLCDRILEMVPFSVQLLCSVMTVIKLCWQPSTYTFNAHEQP